MKTVSFAGKILLLGYGGVARCVLPLLLKHLDVDGRQITVMDLADKREELEPYRERGITFVQVHLRRETMAQQLGALVHAGDMIIDLARNIDCCEILQWCHDHDVLYINTSVGVWDPYANMQSGKPVDHTLYVRHIALRKMIAGWKDKGTTAVLEHGANPGLVSHFTKRALRDIAQRVLENAMLHRRHDAIEDALRRSAWPELSLELGVKAIHISEIDTQRSSIAHDPNVFLNTWSVEGLYEEGTSPAEMGWGTHEEGSPAGICRHAEGPKNQICLRNFGIDTYVKSRVPSGEIVGMVVRHGEAFTISDFLTVRDRKGSAVYRPTVHYAYCPCPAAVASLKDLRKRDYVIQDSWTIMGDDILPGGRDELGVLLMGHDLKSWWTGTILSIDETRLLVPGQNATTLQVAAAVLGGVLWMIGHPQEGVLVPDQLPFEDILDIASPYLGVVASQPIDWSPVPLRSPAVWQFESFHLPRATARVLEMTHQREQQRQEQESSSITIHVPQIAPARVRAR